MGYAVMHGATFSGPMPLHWAFDPDVGKLVESWFPGMGVNAQAIRNEPSHADPLGARPPLSVAWCTTGSGRVTEVQFALRGRETPWLEPAAMRVYLCVEWPHVFTAGV